MITGEIKNRIDSIWDTFCTGYITNSITILEQMTYLFFAKMLDDSQRTKEATASIMGVTVQNPTFFNFYQYKHQKRTLQEDFLQSKSDPGIEQTLKHRYPELHKAENVNSENNHTTLCGSYAKSVVAVFLITFMGLQ